MTSQLFRVSIAVTLAITALTLASAVAYAQAPAYTPERTPDGQPKIPDGIYNQRGVGGLDRGSYEAQDQRPDSPLWPEPENPLSVSRRPDGLSNPDSGVLDQFTEFVVGDQDADDAPPPPTPAEGQQQELMGIAEPGKILPWKPAANAARQAFLYKTNPAQGLVYVEMDARCAQPGLFFGRGPFQFLQAPGKVVILSEYQHHTRTIYLDGRPHLGEDFKLFMGDSVGHWEGNTLVVDTTNFNGVTSYSREIPYLTTALQTVERFTLTDANTIDYEIMIDDPIQFTRPWKSTGQFTRADDLTELLEYACAEGSISVRNILGDPPSR